MANTHKVATGGPALLLNPAPSNTEVSDLSQISDAVGVSLADGTEFIIFDEGLGFKCKWVRVLVGSQEGYLHSRYIARLSNTPLSLEVSCQEKVSVGLPHAVDWTTKELNRSYYDKYLQKWCVPVETAFTSGGSDLQARTNLYLKPGLEIILRDNGKLHDEVTLNNILGRFISASVDEYYIDPRRNGSMRVLVTFPDKYMDPLPDIPREAAYSLLEDFSTIHLSASTYERDIERVAVIAEEYAKKIEQFKGQVDGIDLKLEADNLRLASSRLSSIMSDNNIELKDDTTIEIGLNSEFEATSISENSLVVYRTITRGVAEILDSAPFDSPRTMNYLFKLSEIYDEAVNNGLTWTDFLENYTIPLVVTKMNKSKSDASSNSSSQSVQDLYRSLGIGAGNCVKSVKTKKELISFQNMMLQKGEQIKKEFIDYAQGQADYIGSQLYKELGLNISKVKSLDDLYEQILNKICLTDLLGALSMCLEMPSLSPEAQKIKNLLPPMNNCHPDPCMFKPVIKIQDNLPTKDWLSDYAEIIYKTIIDALTQMFLELVKDIIETLKSVCDGNDDPAGVDIGNLIGTPPDGIGPLLGDLSNLLSASELCSCFQGNASQSTISLIRSVIQKLHPEMAPAFKTKSSIISLFSGIGSLIDSSFCEDLSNFPSTPSISCDDPFAPNQALITALADKDITEEELRDQLDKAEERKKNRLDKVATIVEMLGDPNSSSGVESLMPALLGSGGLVNLNHYTYDHMQDVVFDSIFSPLYTSFDKDSNKLKNFLIEKTYEKVQIPWRVNFNRFGREYTIINPEVKAMAAKGITMRELGITEKHLTLNKDDEGDLFPAAKRVDLNLLIPVDRDYDKTNKHLISLLKNVESSDTFNFGADGEGLYYELRILQNSNVLDLLQTLPESDEWDLETLKNNISNLGAWRIRYKVPYMTDQGVDSEIDDDYIIEIFPDDLSKQGLRKRGRGVIDQEVLDFINGELTNSGTSDIEIGLENVVIEETIFAEEEEEVCLTPEEFALPQPTQLLTPPPQSVFGRYVHHIWDEAIMPFLSGKEYSSAQLNTFGTRIEKYFAQTLFPQASRDLLAVIARQIAKSPLLADGIKQSKVFGIERDVHVPKLSTFSFSRMPTRLEKACNIDPHLLKLDKYKSEIINAIAQIPEEELLDGMNSVGTDPWSKSVLKSIVKLTVRAYCFDYALRCMFMATEFTIEDNIDNYIKEFIMDRIVSEMNKYNPEYPIILSDISNEMYAEMISVDVDTLAENEGFFEIIGQSLEEVFVDLKCIFKQENITVSSNNVKEKIIQEWIPMIDLVELDASQDAPARFANLGESLTTMDEALHKFLVTLPAQRIALEEQNIAVADALEVLLLPAAVYNTIPQEYFTYNRVAIHLSELYDNAQKKIDQDDGAKAEGMDEQATIRNQKTLDYPNNEIQNKDHPDWKVLFTTPPEHRQEIYEWMHQDLAYEEAKFVYDKAIEELDRLRSGFGNILGPDGELIDVIGSTDIDPDDLEIISSGYTTPSEAAEVNIRQKLELSSIVQDGETISFDLSNGNFFLERSIRLKRNDWETMKQRLKDEGVSDVDTDVIVQIFSIFFYTIIHPVRDGDFDIISRATVSEKKLRHFMALLMPAIHNRFKKIQGGFKREDIDSWSVTAFFEEMSSEIRLMYLPPSNQDQFDAGRNTEASSSNNEFEKAMNVLRGADDTINDAIKELGSTSAAYMATEHVKRETYNVQGENIVFEPVDRDVYPIPLIDTFRLRDECKEYSELFDDDWKLADLYTPSPDSTGIGEFNISILDDEGQELTKLRKRYDNSIAELKERLLDSMEFKLLFDFVFPVDRYVSMLLAYTLLSTTSIDGVSRSFNQTKDHLYSLFNTFKNAYDFRQDGPSNKDVQKIAEQFSKDGCFSFDDIPKTKKELIEGEFETKFKTDWDEDDNPFKGKGLDYIEEMAKETGKIIFKKLVEYNDPNIAAAKTIKEITKNIGFCGDTEIPLWVISLGLLPPFLPFPPLPVFGYPAPFAPLPMIGNGPVLTPFGILYLAGWSYEDGETKYYSKPSPDDPDGINCNDVETC